jgi:hypothetical protein
MYGPEAGAGNLDDPPFIVTGQEKDDCLAHTRRVIEFVKKNIFPLHGISGERGDAFPTLAGAPASHPV